MSIAKSVIAEFLECIEYCNQLCRDEGIEYLGNCKKSCFDYFKTIDKSYGDIITHQLRTPK